MRETAEHYEQLGKLQKDRRNIEAACGEFISSVIAKYQKEEKEISDRMDQEAEKNRNDKEEIIQLTKKQLKAEMQGNSFTGENRLEELKVKAAAYPQKIEALKQIKAEVCVSAADMKLITKYEYAGGEIIRQIQKKAEEISNILFDVQNRIILNCLAILEIPPGRTRFMNDQLQILQDMRKEEIFSKIPGMRNIVRNISTCTYSANEAERCGCDGQASVKMRRIALCEDIITKENESYWKMVFLHELAHILTDSGHSKTFHKLFDFMIDLYNEETGEQLKNDYEGITR